MTNAEWLACKDSQLLLGQLCGEGSRRKVGLFVCACLRRLWADLTDERSRQAVEVAERFADARATDDELREASEGAWAAHSWVAAGSPSPVVLAAYAAAAAAMCVGEMADAQGDWLRVASAAAARLAHRRKSERAAQASLLRELVGNPFRRVSLANRPPPSVVALAADAYEYRELPSGQLDPERLAVLGDALEESGCDSPEILSALLDPVAVRVRGFWALDLVLSKD